MKLFVVRLLRLHIREYYWKNISEYSKKWEKDQTRQVFSLCSGQFLFVCLFFCFLFAFCMGPFSYYCFKLCHCQYLFSTFFFHTLLKKAPTIIYIFCKWTLLLILNSLWWRHVFMEKLLLIGIAKASHWPYRVILAWLFIILVCSDQIN